MVLWNFDFKRQHETSRHFCSLWIGNSKVVSQGRAWQNSLSIRMLLSRWGIAWRYWGICPLSGPARNELQHVCWSHGRLFPASRLHSLLCVLCMQAYLYIFMDYHVYTWVSICFHVCVCASVYTRALFRPRVLNSSECGCVFTHTDAVWWSECQYCSRLPVMFCFAAVCFWVSNDYHVHPLLCVCVFALKIQHFQKCCKTSKQISQMKNNKNLHFKQEQICLSVRMWIF